MDAGGYDLVLKPGSYTVTFSGPGMAASTQSVTIGTKNVKKDLMDPVITSGTLSADASVRSSSGPTPAPVPNTSDGRRRCEMRAEMPGLRISSSDPAIGTPRGVTAGVIAARRWPTTASAADVSGHNNHSRGTRWRAPAFPAFGTGGRQTFRKSPICSTGIVRALCSPRKLLDLWPQTLRPTSTAQRMSPTLGTLPWPRSWPKLAAGTGGSHSDLLI